MKTAYLLIHEESYGGWGSDGDYEQVLGVFDSPEEALGLRHAEMRARNNDGTVSFRRGDKRPKVLTLSGCCRVLAFPVGVLTSDPEVVE